MQRMHALHFPPLLRILTPMLIVVLVGSWFAFFPSSSVKAAPAMTGLHVEGNQIKNSNGQVVQLHGVNRSGTEYMCINGWGIFDGPSNGSSIDAMKSWNINVVRIPLNETCWLGINGAPAAYSGENYRNAIRNYVNLINSKGLAVILDLHWAAPGGEKATGQRAMPNADHSYTFWWSVSDYFENNKSVIFDLYNEPFPETEGRKWECWAYGNSGPYDGACPDISYHVAGLKSLLDTVRTAGSQNIVILKGIGWGNWIGEWLQWVPNDPLNNIVAGVHIYNVSGCNNTDCYNNAIGPVAQQYPVLVTEIGQNDCQGWFVNDLMNWADQRGGSVGYLGWAWNVQNCSSFPALISDYNGTPTNFGQAIKNHFWTRP